MSTHSETKEMEIVHFSMGDPDHPWNWSRKRKAFVLMIGVSTTVNCTLGSSLPSGAIPFIAKDFGVPDGPQLVLPISMFLIGYVVGPLVFGPLSETFGRRLIMMSTFAMFTIFTLGCALAPNWPVFLAFRFSAGIAASSPVAVVGGLFADVYNDPVTRGRAISLFMAVTLMGPVFGPTISGFVSPVSWRWTFWVGLIVIGMSWIPLVFLPETYAPTILKKRAQALRKKKGDPNIRAPSELENASLKEIVVVVLTRPVRMFYTEAIILFTCLYLALAYSLFYLFFEAYPIVFQGVYGISARFSGLAFLPIGVGAIIVCGIFLGYDKILQRAKQQNKQWAKTEEYRRLPLACLGGPCIVIALFWIGWTSRADIHWIVPMLSGLFFGAGFLLVFMALLNYLVDAYKAFSASALAASSCTRSLLGACLPFATKAMYSKLGVNWASSLLGFISLVMSIVPFVFIKYGPSMREKSKFCQYLLQQEREDTVSIKGEGIVEGAESQLDPV
ncbi:MAG: hypothetical protein M1814_004590 [Vezdaea aestivalis]|nr:MAG: hypothetical protein M1814_004590 [Vezdaea aestivalis]